MPEVERTTGARTAPADLRMPWLAVAAWVGGLAALAPWWLSTALLAAGLALALTRRSPSVRATVLAGVLVAGGVLASATVRSEAVTTGPVTDLADEGAVVELVGEVRSDPRPVTGRFGVEVVVRLEAHEVVGRGLRHRVAVPVLVIGDPAWAAARLGATVRTTGRLVPADDDGLAALVTGASPPVTVLRPDVWWRAAGAVRASIRDAVAHRPPDQRALVPALVDGDDVGLDPELEADFRTTGLTHLTAVSGTNLTLVVGFLLVCARWCRVRGRWLVLVGALGIVGFVLLARTRAQRAARGGDGHGGPRRAGTTAAGARSVRCRSRSWCCCSWSRRWPRRRGSRSRSSRPPASWCSRPGGATPWRGGSRGRWPRPSRCRRPPSSPAPRWWPRSRAR